VAALFAMNLTHHVVLNKMSNESLSDILKRVDKMEKIASDNFGYINFVKQQTEAIHLRMAAYENTIS